MFSNLQQLENILLIKVEASKVIRSERKSARKARKWKTTHLTHRTQTHMQWIIRTEI